MENTSITGLFSIYILDVSLIFLVHIVVSILYNKMIELLVLFTVSLCLIVLLLYNKDIFGLL